LPPNVTTTPSSKPTPPPAPHSLNLRQSHPVDYSVSIGLSPRLHEMDPSAPHIGTRNQITPAMVSQNQIHQHRRSMGHSSSSRLVAAPPPSSCLCLCFCFYCCCCPRPRPGCPGR
jgi:hypothetical protein